MRTKKEWTAYLFLAPSLIGFLLFIAFPVVFSLLLSFAKWDLVSGLNQMKFIGFGNYAQLFHNGTFYKALQNNVIYALIVIPGAMALSLLLALVLNKMVYFAKLLRLAFFLPYITTIVAVSVVWMALYNPLDGPINQLLHSLGVDNPPGWLVSPHWALVSIAFMMIWVGIGFDLVVYMGALQGIPRHLYEAASIDGAGGGRRFFHVTLPMLSPTNFFLLMTRIISSFQVFGPINIMTAGGPGDSSTVLVYEIYQHSFRFYELGYGSAVAWVLFVVILIITLVQWRNQQKWVTYE